MRTVTFSDKEVAKYVNDNFIPAWHDRGPGFHNDEKTTEQWIYQSSYESYPTKNICTFFLDGEGKVFFYASGYWAPDFFLEIAKSAMKLSGDPKLAAPLADKCERIAKALTPTPDRTIKNLEMRFGLSTKVPETTETKYGTSSSDKDVPKTNWCRMDVYRGLRHNHSDACKVVTGSGFAYLSQVLRAYAKGSELPKLIDIQSKYLYGNEFTEESGSRDPIADSIFDRTPVKSCPSPEMLTARVEALHERLGSMPQDDPSRADLEKLLLSIQKEMATARR